MEGRGGGGAVLFETQVRQIWFAWVVQNDLSVDTRLVFPVAQSWMCRETILCIPHTVFPCARSLKQSSRGGPKTLHVCRPRGPEGLRCLTCVFG